MSSRTSRGHSNNSLDGFCASWLWGLIFDNLSKFAIRDHAFLAFDHLGVELAFEFGYPIPEGLDPRVFGCGSLLLRDHGVVCSFILIVFVMI